MSSQKVATDAGGQDPNDPSGSTSESEQHDSGSSSEQSDVDSSSSSSSCSLSSAGSSGSEVHGQRGASSHQGNVALPERPTHFHTHNNHYHTYHTHNFSINVYYFNLYPHLSQGAASTQDADGPTPVVAPKSTEQMIPIPDAAAPGTNTAASDQSSFQEADEEIDSEKPSKFRRLNASFFDDVVEIDDDDETKQESQDQ